MIRLIFPKHFNACRYSKQSCSGFQLSLIRLALFCALALFFAANANATVISLDTSLNSSQVVPPSVTPATGVADVTLDDVSGSFTVVVGTYQDLMGNSTFVSLNDAPGNSNGVTILSLTLDSPGSMTGTFSGSGTLTAPRIADVLAGKGYILIRSSVFESGEIRGQLSVIPEPSTLALAAFGFISLAAWGWRQRR